MVEHFLQCWNIFCATKDKQRSVLRTQTVQYPARGPMSSQYPAEPILSRGAEKRKKTSHGAEVLQRRVAFLSLKRRVRAPN